MTILHLGVIDFPYANPPKEMQGNKPGSSPSGVVTTGDVATWLENKYHIMEVFFEANRQKIGDAMAESVTGALESLMMGKPNPGNPLLSAESAISTYFKQFLAMRQIEGFGIPGVPTQAALNGVNHRFKNPRGKWTGKGKDRKFQRNPRRPSFIDTGMYQTSSKAWFD